MAEDTPAASAPAAEPAVERAPEESKPASEKPAAEVPKEKEAEDANGSEEKPSENATEEKKDDAPAEKPAAPAESTDAKEPEGDAAAPAESETAPAADANATPASAKKSGGSKRKSTGGEKKGGLSRKKSVIRPTHIHAQPGEYYLARLRSFPPWPSIICDEEILPQSLLTTRPVSAKRSDGTYREDYEEGAKRAHERTFPVMFFQTNEFAWIPNTDLSPIDAEACKEVPEKGKSKTLLSAYKVAAEGHDLQHFKDVLSDHQRAMQQEQEEIEAQAAAKAAAKAEKSAKKNKRKSMEIVDDEDVDMEDAEEGAKKSKSSKKRKKDADEEEKPAKTPKTGTKLKLTTPKTPASETKKAPAKGKQGGNKRKANASEAEEETPAKAPEKEANPEEMKAKREKEVLFVRHKLQKGFISRDSPPNADEMASMSTFISKLENIKDLEVSIIRHTKINKVLKMIVKLSSIPRDEEFNFKGRAMAILTSWKNVLDTDATPAAEDKPKANGVQKEDSVDTPARDTDGEKEEESKKDDSKEDNGKKEESKDEPMPDADAGEKETEKEKKSEKAAPKTDEKEEGKTETEKPAEEKKTEEKTDEKSEEKPEEKPTEAAA